MQPCESLLSDQQEVLSTLARFYAGTPMQLEGFGNLYTIDDIEGHLQKFCRLGYAEIFKPGETLEPIYMITLKGSYRSRDIIIP